MAPDLRRSSWVLGAQNPVYIGVPGDADTRGQSQEGNRIEADEFSVTAVQVDTGSGSAGIFSPVRAVARRERPYLSVTAPGTPRAVTLRRRSCGEQGQRV